MTALKSIDFIEVMDKIGLLKEIQIIDYRLCLSFLFLISKIDCRF